MIGRSNFGTGGTGLKLTIPVGWWDQSPIQMITVDSHDYMMWTTRLSWSASLVTLIGACAPSHAMLRSVEVGSCPARTLARSSASRPDVAARDLLTWSGPSDPRDIERNGAWCRTTGPPVVQAHPQLAERTTRVDSVAILTWNVWVGGADLEAFLAEELKYRCNPDEPAEPTPAFHFVILLQEVYRTSSDLPEARAGPNIPWRIEPDAPPGGRSDIGDVAERCGLALVYVPSARNGPDEPDRPPEDKGNAILSTLPLADLSAIELPFEASRKVAVAATIAGPGGERVRVVSVHLDVASSLTRTLISGNATRLRQALGLATALDFMESIPVVMGGDFNTWSASESTLRRLAVRFPDSPPWDGLPTRGRFPTDHILFRTVEGSRIDLVESSYRRIEEAYGSDHAARIVWLRGHDAGLLRHAHEVRH